jgi:hypothetical protein
MAARFCFAVLFLVLLVAQAIPQTTTRSLPDRKDANGRAVWVAQPIGHIGGNKISYSSNKWATKTQAGVIMTAVGIDVVSSSSGGNLVVHMVGDPAGYYDTVAIPASNGFTQRIGMVFDTVIETGSTITIANVKILF